jgi:hypothetical protein
LTVALLLNALAHFASPSGALAQSVSLSQAWPGLFVPEDGAAVRTPLHFDDVSDEGPSVQNVGRLVSFRVSERHCWPTFAS